MGGDTMRNWMRYLIGLVVLIVIVAVVIIVRNARQSALPAGLPSDALALARERGLTPDDVYAALATYVPGGKHDDCVMVASGGHGGQGVSICVPS